MGDTKALLQGTLDMLVLKALTRGAMHGYAIAEFIQQSSEDVLRACEERGIPFIPHSPNILAGSGAEEVVHEVATAHGVSPQQVAVAWLLAHSPAMVPIPGTSKIAHADDNLDAAWLELTEHERARLDEAGAPTASAS